MGSISTIANPVDLRPPLGVLRLSGGWPAVPRLGRLALCAASGGGFLVAAVLRPDPEPVGLDLGWAGPTQNPSLPETQVGLPCSWTCCGQPCAVLPETPGSLVLSALPRSPWCLP